MTTRPLSIPMAVAWISLALTLPAAAQGRGIYVEQKPANVDGDGSSWAAAMMHLQDALALATDGDTIYVAKGFYYADLGENQIGGSVTARFVLKPGVRIEGGYAGFNLPGIRDITLYETILSGDLSDNDDGTEASSADNSREVIVGDFTIGPSTELNGLTIASGYSMHSGSGGGVELQTGSPTFIDCTFRDNAAGFGGAVHMGDTSSPLFKRCTFYRNRGGNIIGPGDGGAAVATVDGAAPVFIDCRFIENTSLFYGGAIMNTQSAHPTFINCWFDGNQAGLNGGAIYDAALHPSNAGGSTLINCVFRGNRAANGGAIATGLQIDPARTAELRLVSSCSFAGNVALNQGGALFINAGGMPEPKVVNSLFWGNSDAGGTDESGQIHLMPLAGITISYSSVQGFQVGGELDGPFMNGLNPDFILPPSDGGDGWGVGGNDNYGDLHLGVPGSGAIDAGHNGGQPQDPFDLDNDGNLGEAVSLDIEGSVRRADVDDDWVPDTGTGVKPMVDRGAHETTCQEDLGFAGPGGATLSLCGGDLTAGTTAFLKLTGAATNASSFGVIAFTNAPMAFKGGLLVPSAIDGLFPANTGPAGGFTFAVPGGNGPLTLYVQWVITDGAQPQGYALSNALQVVLGS